MSLENSHTDVVFGRELATHSKMLYRLALKYTKNHSDAEDLAQTALVKGWGKRETFERGTNMKAWLQTILINQWKDEKRSLKNQRVENIEDMGAGKRLHFEEQAWIRTHQTAEQEAALELKETLRNIEKISPERAKTLTLFALGYSKVDIASMTEVEAGTVTQRALRGRDELYEMAHPGEGRVRPRLRRKFQ